jgi:MFS family permease
VGGAIMLWLGPSWGIFLNATFYLPTLLWLFVAPRRQAIVGASRVAMRGLADIIDTLREIAKRPILISMTALAGLSSLMIGNAYHAQMPGFAHDLGHGDPGLSYSMLLAADAAGAMFAGVALETWSRLRPRAVTAIALAICWSAALLGFAATGNYPVALALLFAAGFFELSFNAMAQTLVQLNAPLDMRGRVVGLFNMSALGLRAFGGVTVGLIGQMVGIHWSLGASAAILIGLLPLLFRLTPTAPKPVGTP